MTPTEHGDLIERLKAATVGGRELDCLIHEWQNPKLSPAMRGSYYGEFTGEYFEPEPSHPGGYLNSRAPYYTTSVDAALALVERVLPGWMVLNLCEWEHPKLRERGKWTCNLKLIGAPDLSGVRCPHAPHPALALVIATLEALRTHKGEG